jgi:hypothetical protein
LGEVCSVRGGESEVFSRALNALSPRMPDGPALLPGDPATAAISARAASRSRLNARKRCAMAKKTRAREMVSVSAFPLLDRSCHSCGIHIDSSILVVCGPSESLRRVQVRRRRQKGDAARPCKTRTRLCGVLTKNRQQCAAAADSCDMLTRPAFHALAPPRTAPQSVRAAARLRLRARRPPSPIIGAPPQSTEQSSTLLLDAVCVLCVVCARARRHVSKACAPPREQNKPKHKASRTQSPTLFSYRSVF